MSLRFSLRKLIRLSLAVGLLAACLAPIPAHAQEPPGSQGLWQTFTTAYSGLSDNDVTVLLEDRDGGLWVGTGGGGVSHYFEGRLCSLGNRRRLVWQGIAAISIARQRFFRTLSYVINRQSEQGEQD